MNVVPTELPDVRIIEPRVFHDERGYFFEVYNARDYAQAGIDAVFIQDNQSRSCRHSIRGLHYQLTPGQNKLVRCVSGEILDIAVDIRLESPTYGKWVQRVLSAANKCIMYVPIGFAHGFCVLSEQAEVEYKVDSFYDPDLERGIRYDDPTLNIEWPTASPILSERDARLPFLSEADIEFVYSPSAG